MYEELVETRERNHRNCAASHLSGGSHNSSQQVKHSTDHEEKKTHDEDDKAEDADTDDPKGRE
jgi:hypothetical protein